MVPLPLAGLALAARTLVTRYTTGSNRNNVPVKSRTPQKIRPTTRRIIRKDTTRKVYTRKTSNGSNPIQALMQGVSTGLSQITGNFTREDYDPVVTKLLPAGTNVMTPQYPDKAGKYLVADIDGDSRSELVVTYKEQNTLGTLVAKKQNEKWGKVAETPKLEYDNVRYRGMADLTGEGKKQLLLGYVRKDGTYMLHGYQLESNSLKQLFSRPYYRMEVVGGEKGKAQLALWSKKTPDTLGVELLQWNETQLEPVNKVATFYQDRVLPYYAQRVKQTPTSAAAWYQLADALEKTELRTDALTALNMGMRFGMDASLREQYEALKKRMNQ